MKLSFIIPMYNSRRFIDTAVQSCINQGLPYDWEVVCCDDGSKDNTYQYVSNKYMLESRVRVYRHTENKGQTAARRTCFEAATGDWFFTLDHDNALPNDFIIKLMECARETGRQAVSARELRFFKNCELRQVSSWKFDFPDNVCDFRVMTTTTQVPPSGGQYLFSRKLYEDCEGYMELTEDSHGDWGFGFKHVEKGYDISICPNTFYWHQQTDNSMYFQMNQHKWYQQVLAILKKYIYRFDSDSQKLILDGGMNGHELINSGRLVLQ